MSSLLESLGALSAGKHIQAAGGGLVAVVVFLMLLLFCAGSGKGNGKKE